MGDSKIIHKEAGNDEKMVARQSRISNLSKKRDMYIIMDLVINHCSDQHEWFQKALADPDGEYAGYFYFRKGKNGNPPSNYRSYFGGSCWEPVPGTDKYYLHMFAKEQPDLNWENPKLRQELYRMINWWLEKGLAGFRIDAIINIKKNLDFPDFEPDAGDGMVSCCRMAESVDGVGEFLEDLKKNTFQKYDAFTVAEVYTGAGKLRSDRSGLQLLKQSGRGPLTEWVFGQWPGTAMENPYHCLSQ